MKSTRSLLLLAVCLAPAAPLFAVVAAPSESAARDAAGQYRSAFEGYRPHRDQNVADWRSVNDEVARAGGHIGIMRDQQSGAAKGGIQGEPGQAPVRGAPKAPAGHGH